MKNQNKLYCLCGTPGCGKSTYAETLLAKTPHTYIVSTDEIRAELLGNASAQNMGDLIFKTAYERTEKLLRFGLNVIFDSTAAKPIYRERLVEIAKGVGVPAICYHFDIPLETCYERNRGRTRLVPHNIIENMYNNIKKNPPALSEGFEEIMEIFE
jgi:predicted kinase